MTNDLNSIISKHYQLQYGCFFSNIQVCGGILYAHNDIMRCPIWNHCCFIPDSNDFNLERLIQETERYLITRNRVSSIYIDDIMKTEQANAYLINRGYKCVDDEAWLKFSGECNGIDVQSPLRAQKVNNETLNDFLEVCTSCFDEEYSKTINREFHQYQPHKSFSHFVFYFDDVCVASASIYFQGNFFFVHNVGVAKKFRRNGNAYKVMTCILSEVYNMCDSPVVVLQCDGGGYIEEFYKKIGFTLIHRRWGYTCE